MIVLSFIKFLFSELFIWGLGIGPNPQSPIPNPQSPIPIYNFLYFNELYINLIIIN